MPYAALPGETGVLNTDYYYGRTERYGVFADYFSVTGTTNSTNVVTGAVGAFSNAVIGMAIIAVGIPANARITVIAGDGSSVTMNATATASATVVVNVGTNYESFETTKWNAVRDNGKHPRIKIKFPRGGFINGLTMDASWGGTATNRALYHCDHTEFHALVHIQGGVSYLNLEGHFASFDRVGQTGELSRSIILGHVRGAHEVGKNTSNPGRGNRGFHIVSPDMDFESFTLDGCDPTINTFDGTTLAGLCVDGPANARRFRGKKIHIKNSGSHGVYAMGAGWDVDEVLIEAYCQNSISYPAAVLGLEESDGQTQSEQGAGFWGNRLSGRIGSLTVLQGNGVAASLADARRVLLDETGRSAPAGALYKPLVIEEMYVQVGGDASNGRSTVHFGRPDAITSARLHVEVGTITAILNEGDVIGDSRSFVNINAMANTEVDGSIITIGKIRTINPQGHPQIITRTASGEMKQISIGGIDTLGFADGGQVFNVQGHASGTLHFALGPTLCVYGGSDYSAAAMMHFDLVAKLSLTDTHIISSSNLAGSAIRVQNCRDARLSGTRTRGVRGNTLPGAISLSNNTKLTMEDFDLVSAGTVGSGIYFDNGTHTDYTFRNGRCEAFALGTDKHASAAFVRMGVYDCQGVSNSVNSNLLAADSFIRINQTLVTGAGNVPAVEVNSFAGGGAAQIWRNYELDGVPSPGTEYKPPKADIRAWGTNLENRLAAVEAVETAYVTRRGQHTTVTASDTIVTGLATVASAAADLDSDPTDDPQWANASIGNQAGAPAAGSILIKTWKNTGGTDPTPLAATTFGKKVNWIASGTL